MKHQPTSYPRRLRPRIALLIIPAMSVVLAGVTGAVVVRAQGPVVQDIPIGQTVTGSTADGTAQRAYRFTLAALERVAVTVDPPPDGSVGVTVADAGGQPLAVVASPAVGTPWAWVGQLPPGAYQVVLHPAIASQGDLRLRIERLDPFAVSVDQEPNDSAAQARPLPPSLTITGTQDADRDIDWYSLGSLGDPTAMTLTLGGSPGKVHVSDGMTDFPAVADATNTRLETVLLPTGTPLYLRVEPVGAYDIHIDRGAPAVSGPPIPAPLFEAEMLPTVTPATVAAGLAISQHVVGSLSIQNEESDAKRLSIDALTSDEAWTVSVDQPQVQLAGGAVITMPFAVEVPPSATADIPVRISIRARTNTGAQSTGFVDITPISGTMP